MEDKPKQQRSTHHQRRHHTKAEQKIRALEITRDQTEEQLNPEERAILEQIRRQLCSLSPISAYAVGTVLQLERVIQEERHGMPPDPQLDDGAAIERWEIKTAAPGQHRRLYQEHPACYVMTRPADRMAHLVNRDVADASTIQRAALCNRRSHMWSHTPPIEADTDLAAMPGLCEECSQQPHRTIEHRPTAGRRRNLMV